MMLSSTKLLLILSTTIGLCRAESVLRSGPIVVGQTFIAASLDPRSGSTPWALVSHGIAEKLFAVNKKDQIIPQIAESVTKVDESGKVWDVKIKPGVLFSDGTPLDAQHVADSLKEQNANNGNAKSSLGVMTVTVGTEDLTVRIESELPTPVMDAVLAEFAFVMYYMKGDDFIYSGPYMVENFVEGDHIDLAPNPNYSQADERPKVELKKYASGDALAEALKGNEIDVAMHLPIGTLQEIRDQDGIHVRTFEVGYHYMAFYNTEAPAPTSDEKVRKAIDMVLDRDALSQELKGGRGTRSFFPDFSPYYFDESDSHGKVQDASALLDEAGWVLADGKRTKDGNELIIDLVAYPHRPGLGIMQPVIEKQLQSIGITVRPLMTGQEWSQTSTIIESKDFDMLLWAQHTLPAGDPAWFLNAFFRSGGANNHGGFSSSNVDLLLNEFTVTKSSDERVSAAKAVHDRVVLEVPMSNLVTPAWHVGLSDRVVGEYEPWGADYYVIRADTFLSPPTQAPVAAPSSAPEKEKEESGAPIVFSPALAMIPAFLLVLAL